MARSPVAGISGVLGELIGHPSESASESTKKERTITEQKPCPRVTRTKDCAKKSSNHARLGRPTGRVADSQGPKEKVTLRVNSKLIAEYRDWSWEIRCQLGDLVERALSAYWENHRTRR